MNPFEGYRVTSPFGWRIHPVHGDRRFHTGIDLVKTHRAPIHAFVAGEVLFAGFGVSGSGFGNYGNVVAVLDSVGSLHCYGHLDNISVKEGQHVGRGQEVGKQGNTGVGTGSHLHYEVRKKASPSYGWIADAEDRAFEPTQYLIDYYEKEKINVKKFNDIDGHWAAKFIEEAADAGILSGYPDGAFKPDQPVTRAELAVVVAKLLEK